MADPLGLFDSDPGFLEELARGTDEAQQPAMSGMMPQQNMAGMMSTMQSQVAHPGYSNMQGNNYANMQFQNQQPQTQQQYNFNQFNNQPMFGNNVMVSNSGQSQGHVQVNPMMSANTPHRNQFGSPQAGMIPQGQVMYQYTAGAPGTAGPRLPNPAQQMKVGQMQGWNQNPQMFNQQQQLQAQQKPYLSQHDYSIPESNTQMPTQQQVYSNSQPPTQPQPSQTLYMQRIPTPISSQSKTMGIPQTMFQHNSMAGSQNFPQNANMSQPSIPTMTTDSLLLQQQQQQQQQQFMQQKQTSGQYQQFPFCSPPQAVQQKMGDNSASPQQPTIMRFSQTSPTQPNVQHRLPFTMQQQRPSVPMLSPRPTPPPPSPTVTPGLLSPTGSTSSHKGSFSQMEPSPQPSNNANIFQQSANSETVVNDMNQQNFNPGPFSQTLNQMTQNTSNTALASTKIINSANVNTNIVNFPSSQGQNSPNFKVLSPPNTNTSPPQSGVNSEINTLNQQIQQLYSMPQTPQTQQKLLDLQERIRLLKSQQMLQNPRQKQKQQPFQPNVPTPQMNPQQQPQPQSVELKAPQPGTVTYQLNTSTPHQTQPQGQTIQLVQQVPNNIQGSQKILIIQQQPGQVPVNPQQQLQQHQQHPILAQPQTLLTTQVPVPTFLPQPLSVAPPTQHFVINQSLASGGKAQHIVVQNSVPVQPQPNNENITNDSVSSSSQQEKANKIIAEAIAKAQKSGNATIPRVLEPPELPSTLADVENGDDDDDNLVIAEDGDKPKKKRKYTPKKERVPKTSKNSKTPKTSKTKKGKKKEKLEGNESMSEGFKEELTEGETVDVETEKEEEKKPKKKKKKASEKASISMPKRSKKPPATFLKNKKRKRRGSSDGSDVEIKITPPPSPEIDELKRRSGRHVKRKKYLDDVELNLSEEDVDVVGGDTEGAVVKPVQLFVDNPAEEDAVIVDKILGSRIRKKDPDDEDNDENEDEVDEYYVKYKNFSYLHCEWKAENEIKDKRIQGKIRRYQMKKMQLNNYFVDDEELFNPDYVEVDRVLEESVVRDPVTDEEVTHYLVKWRSLSYEESTWELQQDVDPEKVKLFKKFRELPPEEERTFKPQPKASEWEALKEIKAYKGGNTLREYQLEGVNWLTFSWHKKQNCILADEMGLGKTIQSIAFLQEMHRYGIRGPFLVVAPLSTIANWQREFETWTDMNAITYHGTSPSRYMLQEYEMYYRDEEGGKIQDYYRFNAIITTYEIILSDLELLRSIYWRAIIIDEAHRLKNKNCSLIKGLRSFDFEHKVLLSGTPLQNNVEELFSLLNFLEPSQFHSSEAFLAEFGTLRTEEQVDKLKAILKPMMLRRLKEDVEKNIAAKEETIIEVELTNVQKKYYRAILEKNFTFLCKGVQTSGNVPSLMNTMMELRKCCNHPYLINGAEENILSEFRSRDGKEPEHIQALIHASGKFVLLDKLLPKLKQNGNRVLIFSQMIRVLDIIEDYLINKRYLYERLDGRIRGNLRQEAIDRYSKPDSDRFVFLICTKAGGLGINLTAADTVIIYDSDWNPQNDLQAQARCHRIGQSKMVKVYRLITRNSYEREMFDRASMKLGLDKAVLQSMGGEKINPQAQLSKREIEDLLRKGAYGALMDDDNAGDKFCEEDIDQILKGRTQIVQIESEGKGSTFAKASFSVTSNRDDIDINDPEFWQKWAKRADMDYENIGKEELIVDEPRLRKKTARYGNNDTIGEISDIGSDSDTDEDGNKGRKGRRGRRGGDEDEDFEKERHKAKSSGSGYGRSELFKVEKGLLHYGWGRWSDILEHARFKRHMEEKDVENVAKAILLYGLQYYKGDERIKEFIWDLISKDNHEDGGLKNHSGLSAPVPRGRKGKKAKTEESHFDANEEIEKAGIKMDRDIIHNKNAYKRHIHRHSNKVLLRVRTLFYLKHEVLSGVVEQVDQGIHVKDIKGFVAPIADNEPPAYWWDELSDKSLLIGVYKHGYEKYNLMRQDPLLIFLDRCGPPDGAALAAELKDDDDNENDDLDDTSNIKDDDEEESLGCASDAMGTPKLAPATPVAPQGPGEEGEDGKMPFPTVSELNTRLRRIITNYQRDFKKQQLKMQQQLKKVEKREKLDAVFRERESRRKETLQKWTRREETDFYRVVSTYGIEFDRVKGRYIWDKFRVMARLDKKTDEQLTEYFISFYHMCLRVCRKIKEEAYPPTPVYIEAITEERANRCIARIDLLSKIREEIIVHPKMEQRIKTCQKSLDLPSWWIPGKQDRELLIGAARHGLARTDYYIMNDPSLSFLESIKAYTQSQRNSPSNFHLFGKDSDKKDLKTEKDDAGKKTNKDDQTIISEKVSKDDKHVKTENGAKIESQNEDEDTLKKDSELQMENGDKDSNFDSDSSEQTVKTISPKKENVKIEEEADKMEINENGQETEPGEIKKEKLNDIVKKEGKSESEDSEKMNFDSKESVKIDNKESIKSEKDSIKSELKDSVKCEKDDTSEKEGLLNGTSDDVKKEVKEELSDVKEDADEEVRQALEDDESNSEFLDSVSQSLISQWPKDRIVFHRLEQICYCVETGEWPFPPKMKNSHILGIDSSSSTPTRSLTPSVTQSVTPKQEEEGGETPAEKLKRKEKEFDVQLAEGDGLKMTFHKKSEKHRRSLDPMQEAEKTARIQAILAQSLAMSQGSSDDSQQDSILSTQGGGESPFLNGSHMSEEEMMMNRSLMEQGLMFGDRRGRRGRKRKAEKMAEIAMAEALARRQTARAIASYETDSHVPVINLEDGSRLSGDEAPCKKDLEIWLDKHPGYMVDSRDDEIEQGEIVQDFPERRKGRKPKFDPAFLDIEKLTGEENVSVINRMTGKKITGAKAPPLRYLGEWLEQNPIWDVDPKWSELVRAKGSLPKTLLPRVVTPSRRGRRPRDSPLSHSMMAGGDPHHAAALAASIEAMNAAQLMAAYKLPLPFGSMSGMGLNPMMGLSGFGFPSLSTASPMPSEKSDSKHKGSKSSKEESNKHKDDEKNSSSSPHPSFPMMFNPLMYNPALLGAPGLNFPLPTSLAGMDAGFINGHSQVEEISPRIKTKSHTPDHQGQSQAEDLSIKSKKVIENTIKAHSSGKSTPKPEVSMDSDEMPCDLSMKPKSKEDKSKQKICSSDKLSRIVDTLKFRVNKMDEKPSKGASDEGEKEIKKHSLEALLNVKGKHSELSSSSKKEHTESSSSSSSSKKDLNPLSQKLSTQASHNHSSKEPVPKIVQELLAAKQQKEKEEMLVAKQLKLDALLAKQQKLVKESLLKQRSLSAQVSVEESNEGDEEKDTIEEES